MHLINARTLALESLSRDAPPYVILSHTWLSNPEEEVTQAQFHDEALRATKPGVQKIEWACFGHIDKLAMFCPCKPYGLVSVSIQLRLHHGCRQHFHVPCCLYLCCLRSDICPN